MRRIIAFVASAALCLGCAKTGIVPAATEQFAERVRARYRELAAADTAALRADLSDGLVWILGATGGAVGKRELLAAASRPQPVAPVFEIDSVQVRQFADVALVSYRRADRRRVGGYELTTWTRALEAYSRHGDSWLLEHHTQTWITTPVRPIATDRAALEPFVGRYQVGPGYVDDVHWEGGNLTATASGQTVGAILVPVSESAFSPDGAGPLMVFERDVRGRVIGYVQGLPDGQVVRAPRVLVSLPGRRP